MVCGNFKFIFILWIIMLLLFVYKKFFFVGFFFKGVGFFFIVFGEVVNICFVNIKKVYWNDIDF